MSGETMVAGMGLVEVQALAPLLALAAVPLALMALVAVQRNRHVACVVTLAGLAASAALALTGAFRPSVDIGALLHIEPIGLYFVALFAVTAAASTLLSHFHAVTDDDQPEEFYMLLATAALGAGVLALSGHFITLVIGLEILSIALYGLIAYPEHGRAPIESALKYLVLSGVATATMLFGMALVYAHTGTMAFADVGAYLQASGHAAAADPLFLTAQAMILIGMGFKLSLVPFHMWTPDVYEGAPAPVAGVLASIAKAAVVVVMLRYASVTGVLGDPALFNLVSTLAVLSMVVGNLLALRQPNIARVLAYSSIAHLGYTMIALLLLPAAQGGSAALVLAVQATMVYLTVYALASVGAFGVIGMLERDAEGYRGLFWRRPALGAALTVFLVSLAGLPLTGGFIAKYHLLGAGVAGAQWLLVWSLILGSAIGAYYYLRIVVAMLASGEAEKEAAPLVPVAVVALGAVALLVLGVYPAPLLDFARDVMAVPLALQTQ